MLISEETIADIRNSASISEVIGHYIPLVKKGKGYTALCPFHDDHDPSLSISEDKQIYKCFVCGKGGNVFSFVQDFKKISFPESVVEVAKICGKDLQIEFDQKPKRIDPNQKYFDLMNTYASYGNYLLMASKKGLEAHKYLENRGLDDNLIEKFQIGIDPDDDYMYRYLASQNISEEDMIRCNLVRRNERGIVDIFQRRIIFPIHDANGNCVAISARDFAGISDAKYINSAETDIYRKGNILYNLHRAKESIRQKGQVIITEGVMDVIAYERAGLSNVIATLGTACSTVQFQLIKELGVTVVLSYDGDNAGINANLKLGDRLIEAGVNVEVAYNKTGLDPDEIVNKYGNHALRDLCSSRIPFIEFVIEWYRDTYNMSNFSDRKEVTRRVSALIDKLKDPYDIENYTQLLFDLTKIKRIAGVTPTVANAPKKVFNVYTLDGLSKAEYIILSQMVLSPQAIEVYLKDLGCMISDNCQYLAMLIVDDIRRYGTASLSRIYDQTDNEDVKKLITDISTADFLSDESDLEVLRGAISRVNDEIRKEKLKDLKSKITQFEKLDPAQAAEYLKEYTKVLKELGGIQNG